MKKFLTFSLFLAITLSISSCSVISGIFQAGAVVGVIAVVVVIALIIWIISLFRGKS